LLVDVAFAAEDARFQRVAAHAAVAHEIDAVDDKLLVRGGLLLGGGLRIRRGMVLCTYLPLA